MLHHRVLLFFFLLTNVVLVPVHNQVTGYPHCEHSHHSSHNSMAFMTFDYPFILLRPGCQIGRAYGRASSEKAGSAAALDFRDLKKVRLECCIRVKSKSLRE